MNDIDHVFEAAKKDPKDPVTIQALADALEELGADGTTVRALTIDGPTVLVFSHPPNVGGIARLEEYCNAVAKFFETHTGHPVRGLTISNNISIRVIRGQVKE